MSANADAKAIRAKALYKRYCDCHVEHVSQIEAGDKMFEIIPLNRNCLALSEDP